MRTTLRFLLALLVTSVVAACGDNGNTQVESTGQPDQNTMADNAPDAVVEQTAARQLTGEELFIACQGCHTLQEGEPNLVGPNLYGFMGEPAATRPDYQYSPALKDAGLSWDRGSLTAWIVATESMVPGTIMGYNNILSAHELTPLIDYIEKETGFTLATEETR